MPALGERGVSASLAALLGGMFGLLQLPGRALMISRRMPLSTEALVVISLAAQAIGLFIVAAISMAWGPAIGVAIFAVGSGLTALARPSLVYSRFGVARSGYVNGRLSRAQQLGRAVGPVLASSIAAMSSHQVVLILLATALSLFAWRFVRMLAADGAGSS